MEEILDSYTVDFMDCRNLTRTFATQVQPLLIAPTLFLKESTSDVYFLIDEYNETHRVPAHKCILAEKSPVFHQMFYGPLKEKGDVKITDQNFIVSRKGFEGFLQAFYSYDVDISSATVADIYLLADKYDVPDLTSNCLTFFRKTLTIKTIFVAWQLAKKFDNNELKRLCEETFRKNAKKILSSNEFLEVSQDMVQSILSINMFFVDEFTKLTACVKWAKAACERKGIDSTDLQNCKQELGECFKLIRLASMNPEEFITFQSKYVNLITSEEMNSLLNDLANVHVIDEAVEDSTDDENSDSDDTSDAYYQNISLDVET